MLRLAILSARGRLGTFTGALVALFASAVLVMAGGMMLESALRAHPPVERYAGAAAVVTGQQIVGADHDVPLGERARVSSALAARLAAVPGVRAAIDDVSAPAQLGGRTTVAHGWGSAALTPYVLSAGRPPAGPDEVVTGYPAALGARLRLASTEAARTVTVVGVARPRHLVRRQTAIFLTDAEAARLAGHPGTVDAIGVLAGPGFDASRLRAAAGGAVVLTGDARGRAEYPELQQARTKLIAVTASFGGLALFIAMFVVAGTMGLSIQQREREIALLRAVAATPGQIRRMIAWEATIVALIGSAAGIWPGVDPRPSARTCARAPRHRPANLLRQRRLAADRGGHRRRRHGGAARRPGRRTTRRTSAAHPRACRSRSPATAAGPRPRDRGTAGARRRGAAVRRLGHHPRPGHGRSDIGDDGAVPRAWRSASSDRSWPARPPGYSGHRLRGSRPSEAFWPPRTCAPPRGASRRPARRWCSPSR